MQLNKSLDQASVFIPQITARYYTPRLFSLDLLRAEISVSIIMDCRQKVLAICSDYVRVFSGTPERKTSYQIDASDLVSSS